MKYLVSASLGMFYAHTPNKSRRRPQDYTFALELDPAPGNTTYHSLTQYNFRDSNGHTKYNHSKCCHPHSRQHSRRHHCRSGSRIRNTRYD